MTGLFGRGCLKKVKRSELPMGTRVISSRFHHKIKRHSAGEHKLPGTAPVWSAMMHVHGYSHEMEGRGC
jgi:hypothetical protein